MGKMNWMQNLNLKKGALHKDLKVPAGKKIPDKKLAPNKNDSPKVAKRKALAITFRNSH